MKRFIGRVGFGAVVMVGLMTGCADSRTTSVEDTLPGTPEAPSALPDAPDGTTVQSPSGDHVRPFDREGLAPAATTDLIKVRLAGADVRGASALLVNVSSLRAWADGKEIAANIEKAAVDLSFEGNAYLVGTVAVPKGAKSVKFQLELDDSGGYAPQDASKAGGVAVREVPLVWTSQAEWLAPRGHTVVHLDVARSLTWANDGWSLLPHVMVLH